MKLYNPTSFSTAKNDYPAQKIRSVISSRSQRWQYRKIRHLSSCKTVLKRNILRLHFQNSTKQSTTIWHTQHSRPHVLYCTFTYGFTFFRCFVFSMFYVMYCNVLILRYIGYTVRSYVICNSVLAVHIM